MDSKRSDALTFLELLLVGHNNLKKLVYQVIYQYFQDYLILKTLDLPFAIFFAQSASFSKPLRQTISFSEIDPRYKLLIKVTAPDDAIPIRPL